jgi:hypothetical protein
MFKKIINYDVGKNVVFYFMIVLFLSKTDNEKLNLNFIGLLSVLDEAQIKQSYVYGLNEYDKNSELSKRLALRISINQ